jgi:Methyltransferase small domain
MYIQSPHGKLRLIAPIYKNTGLSNIAYNKVTDNISHKVLYNRMGQEKSIELISEKSSYIKIIELSKNLRKKLRIIKPDTTNCKSPKDIFHLYRRLKIEHAHFLSRVGFTIDKTYRPFIRFAPDISILPSAIRTYLDAPEDVFMPLNIWDGIISANQWYEKGVHIESLGDKIYPLYSVWPPTGVEYLQLFNEYLANVSVSGTAIDLGCGTGVLGMILAKKGMSAFGVDSNFEAAKSSNLNAQKLGLDFTAVHGDASSISIPDCDLIVCNPPWIPARPSSALDTGNYDPEETLLKSVFKQTKKLKSNGKLLLFYSDLAQNLELQAKGRIEQLCIDHELVIKKILTKKFPITLDVTHPLKHIRDDSNIFLYEISRL